MELKNLRTSLTCTTTDNSTTTCKWRVGYWLSSKKLKKFKFEESADLWRSIGIELVQINLDYDLEEQGPFDAIVHKLSDVIVQADQGDEEAKKTVSKVENYIAAHPNTIIVDPLSSIRLLCDRYLQYSLIQEICRTDAVYTPPFVDLLTSDQEENARKITAAGVSYPFLCKPLLAHGCTSAHEMSIIFGEHGLKDVRPPCVAQSFVPHNAVLYKVFVIGNKYFTCPRPSLKNFVHGDFPTIFFHSHDVSKDGCTSELSEIDEVSKANSVPPNAEKVAAMVQDIRDRTGLTLFGLDVIVEIETEHHYIIDVNSFPGYEGVPDFYDNLLQLISDALNARDIELSKRMAVALSPVQKRPWTTAVAAGVDVSFDVRADVTLVTRITADIRGRTPPDSGIGSCTESDNSDCEKKLMAALRIRQEQQQRQQQQRQQQQPVENAASNAGVLFRPSWQRIKKFYGIPRPLSGTSALLPVPQSSTVVAKNETTPEANTQKKPVQQPVIMSKLRSRTLP